MGERRSCLVHHRSGLRRGCDHGHARRRSHEYRLCRIDPRSTVASIESDDSTTSTSSTTTVVVPASISSTVSTLTDVSDIAAIAVTSVARVEATVSFRGRERVAASGSGVIVDGQGTIVTNTHVVETGTGVDVTLNDGSTHTGTVIGVDTDHDLAVISIDCTGLTPVEFGSIEDLLVGDPVIAIGYQVGLEGGPSVSTGIVSAKDRAITDSGASLSGVIQTDAAITEGSSGGAPSRRSGTSRRHHNGSRWEQRGHRGHRVRHSRRDHRAGAAGVDIR
jgi:S1-C subfamily serine protease